MMTPDPSVLACLSSAQSTCSVRRYTVAVPSLREDAYHCRWTFPASAVVETIEMATGVALSTRRITGRVTTGLKGSFVRTRSVSVYSP